MGVKSLTYVVLGILLAVGGVVAFTAAGPIDIYNLGMNESLNSNRNAVDSPSAQDSGLSSSRSESAQSLTATSGEEPGSSTVQIDTKKIEWEIHKEINEVRKQRGLDVLKMDSQLQEIARNHSADMAEREYFSHESPDGDRVEDRYAEAGYNCRVPVSNNEYVSGGENIAATWAYGDIDTNVGELNHDGNETSMAKGIVSRWMNSPGHRENIVFEDWRFEGIGVEAVKEDGSVGVYATQNFC